MFYSSALLLFATVFEFKKCIQGYVCFEHICPLWALIFDYRLIKPLHSITDNPSLKHVLGKIIIVISVLPPASEL